MLVYHFTSVSVEDISVAKVCAGLVLGSKIYIEDTTSDLCAFQISEG